MSLHDYLKGHSSTAKAPGGDKSWTGQNPGPYLEFSIEGEDYYPWQQNLFLNDPFRLDEGKVEIKDIPGWGVEINPDWLKDSDYKVSLIND